MNNNRKLGGAYQLSIKEHEKSSLCGIRDWFVSRPVIMDCRDVQVIICNPMFNPFYAIRNSVDGIKHSVPTVIVADDGFPTRNAAHFLESQSLQSGDRSF
jgi:hypothetical protein